MKVSKTEIDTQVKRVADILQISDMLNRKPSVLSGGEMQRVALGRAMVRQPKVYLLDEPMANLDAKIRVDTRAEIKRLQHEIGATTIFVTHDQVEAMSLADRIAVIHQGVLQQIGTPHEIYNQPQSLFVAGFMGMPTMNLLDAELTLKDGESVLYLSHTDVHLRLSPKRQTTVTSGAQENGLVFGIRPEHITAASQPGEHNISAHVHLIEPLGAVNILDIPSRYPFGDAGAYFASRANTSNISGRSRRYGLLGFDETEMHLFDRQQNKPSGKAIYS